MIITLLQGYNISLQHKNYIFNETDKINSELKVTVDEEYAIRAYQNYTQYKDGKQRLYSLLSRLEIIGPEKARI